MAELFRRRPPRYRRRARARLPAQVRSLQRARELVEESLTAWQLPELISVTKVVVTTLVENVLAHTSSEPGIRLETDGRPVTVAVPDTNPSPAVLREDANAHSMPTGLRMVAALSRAWGNAPTPSGKTVWVVIGAENWL